MYKNNNNVHLTVTLEDKLQIPLTERQITPGITAAGDDRGGNNREGLSTGQSLAPNSNQITITITNSIPALSRTTVIGIKQNSKRNDSGLPFAGSA